MTIQTPIPANYGQESTAVLIEKIMAHKKSLGAELLILGHHYQEEATFGCADMVGDSLKLARQAAQADAARFIVFCGVHFMAESADILTGPGQAIFLPHLGAGCPMADMATIAEVEGAWQQLAAVMEMTTTIPITYVNSSADIKAFVGERGGSVCTSSNAERVLAWALAQGERIFFFPDEHLGRNSAKALGIDDERVLVWRRGEPLGGNSVKQLQHAQVLLWDGYCEVHMEFSAAQIEQWRQKIPGIKVIIHPESNLASVQAADKYGSTEAIIAAIAEADSGSSWAIGTEVNLVSRLQRQYPDKDIHLLAPTACTCQTMALVTPAALLWQLDQLAAGHMVNQIRVPAPIAKGAKMALDRMLVI